MLDDSIDGAFGNEEAQVRSVCVWHFGSGFRVSGFGFRFQGGLSVWGLGLRVEG